jgi:hypothetical protein
MKEKLVTWDDAVQWQSTEATAFMLMDYYFELAQATS